MASRNAKISIDAFGGGDSTLDHTTRPLEFILEQLLLNVERHVACALRLIEAFFPKNLLVRSENVLSIEAVSQFALHLFDYVRLHPMFHVDFGVERL